MNWSKAKSILIMALVVTNLILLGLYFYDRHRVAPYEYSRDFAKEVRAVLEKKDIRIEGKIPTDKVMLPVLEVSYESFPLEELKTKFFHQDAQLVRDDQNLKLLVDGGASLSVIDNRRILYEREFTGQKDQVSLDSADKLVKDFLRSKGYPTDDFKLIWKKDTGDGWDFIFTKIYNEYYVESTYMAISLRGNQVVKMDRLWINVLSEEARVDSLQSASKSLLSFLDRPEIQGRTIKAIDPAYFFNPEETGALEDLTRSLEGKSGLAWRIFMDNGEEIMLTE